ncbi:uncharacterized protein M421DRAFT_92510 [Didymella exigua CBS 183.55]|uniref:Uncharacterized protein n=1 Tax=Didymella exigua CBS 183.55 TaxID=1150837 RepID=A0A6A5RPJ4_9PLEO|nr:uncharacterized protein M421DRAFT_92510 [Didymella exigua CBS 183.55]KAF1928216.1 hypothetical protein M421DRAFT_92510 [Didymella exigua CBS 183.55]
MRHVGHTVRDDVDGAAGAPGFIWFRETQVLRAFGQIYHTFPIHSLGIRTKISNGDSGVDEVDQAPTSEPEFDSDTWDAERWRNRHKHRTRHLSTTKPDATANPLSGATPQYICSNDQIFQRPPTEQHYGQEFEQYIGTYKVPRNATDFVRDVAASDQATVEQSSTSSEMLGVKTEFVNDTLTEQHIATRQREEGTCR